jgi:hypothetical protein
MNQIHYQNRCRCNEEFSIAKKRKSVTRSEGKPIQYPDPELAEIFSKTFQIKYEKKLSLIAKLVLNSFQNKYIYYAIDDILYLFELNSNERENLLAILYSPILSLQNNYSVNFFDIWVKEIYIDEVFKMNKFLSTDSQTSKQFSYITIKLFYKTRVPLKKQESLW